MLRAALCARPPRARHRARLSFPRVAAEARPRAWCTLGAPPFGQVACALPPARAARTSGGLVTVRAALAWFAPRPTRPRTGRERPAWPRGLRTVAKARAGGAPDTPAHGRPGTQTATPPGRVGDFGHRQAPPPPARPPLDTPHPAPPRHRKSQRGAGFSRRQDHRPRTGACRLTGGRRYGRQTPARVADHRRRRDGRAGKTYRGRWPRARGEPRPVASRRAAGTRTTGSAPHKFDAMPVDSLDRACLGFLPRPAVPGRATCRQPGRARLARLPAREVTGPRPTGTERRTCRLWALPARRRPRQPYRRATGSGPVTLAPVGGRREAGNAPRSGR